MSKTIRAPAGEASRMEMVVKMAARRLFDQRRELRKAVGSRPFRGEDLSAEEAMAEYMQVRHNRLGWAAILRDNTKTKEDGTVLIRKDLVDSINEFEQRIAKGEEDATHT